MFRTLTAALIAGTFIAAPALAQNVKPLAPMTDSRGHSATIASKPLTIAKTVKVKKHKIKKHKVAKHRIHGKHAKHLIAAPKART